MNTEQRLTDLETALAEYIRYNTQAQQRFEAESKQFREEMLAFKETLERDTQAFKDEMRRDIQAFGEKLERDTEAFKAAMQALTERLENDLKDSKRQMENELKESKRQWNKQWGELSNKLGTIVEDIIFPASRPVIESVFGVKVQQLATRVFRQQGNLRAEFDVVAVSERQVFLIEVKSTPRFDYLTDFVDNRIPVFRQLFPEYTSLDLVPIFASLSIPDDIVKAATNRRVFAMAYREWEYMDILNAKELLPNL